MCTIRTFLQAAHVHSLRPTIPEHLKRRTEFAFTFSGENKRLRQGPSRRTARCNYPFDCAKFLFIRMPHGLGAIRTNLRPQAATLGSRLHRAPGITRATTVGEHNMREPRTFHHSVVRIGLTPSVRDEERYCAKVCLTICETVDSAGLLRIVKTSYVETCPIGAGR